MRIIALANNSWNGTWMNRQQLLSRLTDEYEILYSTGPWYAWERYRQEFKLAPILSTQELNAGVMVDMPGRWLVRWPRVKQWDLFVIGHSVKRWKKALGGTSPLIAYIFSPEFAEYLPALNADYVVYHAYDRFSLKPGWSKKKAAQYQRELASNADLVIATSESTANELRSYRKGVVYTLSNGVDIKAFDALAEKRSEEPDDLAKIPRPRIGYVGTQSQKVDYALIAKLAQRNPKWNFIFVGRKEGLEGNVNYTFCNSLPNVYFLGPKSNAQSLQYIWGMDVNILNYRVDETNWWTSGCPLKLHEYMAAGHPIVSCDLEELRKFSELIEICENLEQWENALHRAIIGQETGNQEMRRIVARENSWDNKVIMLKGLIQKMVVENKSS